MDRDAAVDRLVRLLDAVDEGPLPVPVREVWVFGDLALGVDPVDRLDVYVTKDLWLGEGSGDHGGRGPTGADGPDAGDRQQSASTDADLIPDAGVEGIGDTVSADWATQFPDRIRTNEHGHVAPERCLAAHLVDENEPIHLEVCNASFGDNVVQRLRGAQARDAFDEALDPRGVCCWIDGERDDEAIGKLRESAFAFPPLSAAFEMLGLDDEAAASAAEAVHAWRDDQAGATVRGDVV